MTAVLLLLLLQMHWNAVAPVLSSGLEQEQEQEEQEQEHELGRDAALVLVLVAVPMLVLVVADVVLTPMLLLVHALAQGMKHEQ